jgi:Lipoprotein LpqB beta-propeller domain/Sporulation and spore germination
MSRPRLLVAALVLAVLADLGAAGCVSLPRQGPVRSAAVAGTGDGEALVDYTPSGPLPGSTPGVLVDHFLTSMTATPLNTVVAREFLTSGSSRAWVPERGTVIYGTQQLVSEPGGRVSLRLRDVVELDARGTWRGDPTRGRGHDYRLRLVKEDGEWRISNPPDRLMIPRTHFDTEYQQFLLYFLDTTATVLVPEPVYVPRGRQAPTLLLASLLRGPDPALRRSERTSLPRGTALDGISVPVSRDGTAEVPLNSRALDVDGRQQDLVFAQIAWTLGQVPGVQRVRVTVGGTPIDPPGSAEDVSVDAFSQFDPSVGYASTALFGSRDRRVVSLEGSGEDAISGPSGVLPLGLRSIAVDLLAQRVAGVSADGRSVLESDRDGVPGRVATLADVRTVYAGGTDVLRPAYDVYGQLWVLDRTRPGARLSVVRAGTARQVPAPGVSGRDVRRFVLSRDGTRLVVQVRRGGTDRLLLARVRRDTKGRVTGLGAARPLAVEGSAAPIVDIGWRSPAGLAVLTAPSPGTSQVLVVKVDGSSTSPDLGSGIEPFRGRAVRLVASPAAGTPLLLGTVDGRLWALTRRGRWERSDIRPGLEAPTFVG